MKSQHDESYPAIVWNDGEEWPPSESQGQYVPMVIERNRGQERGYDLFSRMLIDRIVFLGGPITSTTADVIVAQLLFLESQDPEKPITMYINTPGGEVVAGMAIVDTMNFIRPPMHTVVIGRAASMGAVILASGEQGQRMALPNAEIMIHQVLGGAQGQATDIEIHARHILRTKERLNQVLAERTGQPYERVCADTERDNFMEPPEALEYGIIDQIVERQ
ncbi:ATP-dependent Clp protease proteolytic subunit [Patescibacteria group bacterium]